MRRTRAAPRLRIVGHCDELLLTGTHLQRKRALPGLGQQLLRLEAVPDLRAEPEAVEPACREDDRVEAPLSALPQPRVDVSTHRLDRERRLERKKLRPAPNRRRADAHPGPDRIRSAKRVAWILARRVGAHDEPGHVRRGHVLRGVDGDVDATL